MAGRRGDKIVWLEQPVVRMEPPRAGHDSRDGRRASSSYQSNHLLCVKSHPLQEQGGRAVCCPNSSSLASRARTRLGSQANRRNARHNAMEFSPSVSRGVLAESRFCPCTIDAIADVYAHLLHPPSIIMRNGSTTETNCSALLVLSCPN